jgi:acyl carrier protein
MLPSTSVFLDRFPLTPSGKLDRKALPAPDLEGMATKDYAAPETALHGQLTDIWTDLLPLGRIGIDDNFFELGGHSLLATRVVNRINRDFGINLSLRTLFEQPTVRGLAMQIEPLVNPHSVNGGNGGGGGAIPALPRVARTVSKSTKQSGS